MRPASLSAGMGAGVLAVLALALTACGASAQSTRASAACAGAAPGVLARAAGQVATRIYAGEVAGTETRSDRRQIETNGALLRALAAGRREALTRAVTTLVFSHTHIVRLRIARGSTVLADVGGPFILAPVSGRLRLGGRTIGRYVFSVQDDLGYIKLESRFVGAPMVIRAGSRQIPVEGQLPSAPRSIPSRGPVQVAGVRYEAFSFAGAAFPSGPLRISLLVPVPPGLAGKSCASIRSDELGRVARRISRRFSLSPANLPVYVKLAASLTGGLLYVRSGSRQLAGSTRPGPPRLPDSGSVSYRGASYTVYSFLAPSTVGRVRVYQLSRAAAP